MTIIGSIISLVVGLLILAWTTHVVLTILGWVLVIAGGVWLLVNLFGNKSRTDL